MNLVAWLNEICLEYDPINAIENSRMAKFTMGSQIEEMKVTENVDEFDKNAINRSVYFLTCHFRIDMFPMFT